MIVVNPYEVTRSVDFSYAPGKCGVRGCISRIVRVGRGVFSCYILPKKIMEQRP